MTDPATKLPRSNGAVFSRRAMLERAGLGMGSLALAMLLADDGRLAADEVAGPQLGLHFAPRAKHVICLFMGGGPSHVDTFDPKPELTRLNGQNVPDSIAKDIPKIARSGLTNLWGSPFKFAKHGQSGIEISELYPEVARYADDLCVVRSMRHPSPVHSPAEYIALTGSQTGERPSLGSWVNYGLGSENQDLPGFVVMLSGTDPGEPSKLAGWHNGFLPARYQGVRVRNGTISNLKLHGDYTLDDRRSQLDLLSQLNRRHYERHVDQTELEARIRSYELAFRMQTAAPEAFDLGGETAETRQLYGLDQTETAEFGTQCLLARRFVERGVRFVQLRLAFWDAHGDLVKNHTELCKKSDRPIAALLADLKRCGLLQDTLVIWGGEFGRTPAATGTGRDHSPSGYSMWLAGGGVKGGQVIGATDPIGYAAVERPIHPNDLHATLLHALGIDQQKLYYMHHNRREIVTVNGGEVIKEVFA
jgi:hypothetical protein